MFFYNIIKKHVFMFSIKNIKNDKNNKHQKNTFFIKTRFFRKSTKKTSKYLTLPLKGRFNRFFVFIPHDDTIVFL